MGFFLLAAGEKVKFICQGIQCLGDSDSIRKVDADNIIQLQQANKKMLHLQAESGQVREVWVDFDDSVITVFGEQDGAKEV